MGWICGALGGFRFFGTVLIGSSSKKSRFSCVLWQVDFTEKITKSVIFIFYFSNQYYCTHGYSRHILTCNMNFESPNALVFIVYKEFLKKIFQTTKIGKNMSRIFFYSPLIYRAENSTLWQNRWKYPVLLKSWNLRKFCFIKPTGMIFGFDDI